LSLQRLDESWRARNRPQHAVMADPQFFGGGVYIRSTTRRRLVFFLSGDEHHVQLSGHFTRSQAHTFMDLLFYCIRPFSLHSTTAKVFVRLTGGGRG